MQKLKNTPKIYFADWVSQSHLADNKEYHFPVSWTADSEWVGGGGWEEEERRAERIA